MLSIIIILLCDIYIIAKYGHQYIVKVVSHKFRQNVI
jgi:hypothetical protein